jgi:hypothetical protein
MGWGLKGKIALLREMMEGGEPDIVLQSMTQYAFPPRQLLSVLPDNSVPNWR